MIFFGLFGRSFAGCSIVLLYILYWFESYIFQIFPVMFVRFEIYLWISNVSPMRSLVIDYFLDVSLWWCLVLWFLICCLLCSRLFYLLDDKDTVVFFFVGLARICKSCNTPKCDGIQMTVISCLFFCFVYFVFEFE